MNSCYNWMVCTLTSSMLRLINAVHICNHNYASLSLSLSLSRQLPVEGGDEGEGEVVSSDTHPDSPTSPLLIPFTGHCSHSIYIH